MDTESYFLSLLQKEGITHDISDDCANLSQILRSARPRKSRQTKIHKKGYIIAADGFVENIHFKRHIKDSKKMQKKITTKTCVNPNQWFSYENLAKKAFLVNISDMLSSGALPCCALLSIVLPKDLEKADIQAIVKGIADICKQYNIRLIGGDTMRGRELSFHITMIGNLLGHYLHRNAIKNGDLLAYTSIRKGNIGTSLKTLRTLLRYGASINTLPHNILESKHAYARFCLPYLRKSFLMRAHRFLHSCMDISDGLGNEIMRLEKANKLHFLPYKTLQKHIYQSGEEYELLFSFHKKNYVALQKIAHLTRTRLHVIGEFGRYKPHFFHTIKWHT